MGDGRKGVVWYSHDKMIVLFSDDFAHQEDFLKNVGRDLVNSYLKKYPSTLDKDNEGTLSLEEERCPQLGYRVNGSYCSEDGEYLEQLKEGDFCENNFECSTNLCIDNKCIGSGFLQRIFAWFKRLFGGSN